MTEEIDCIGLCCPEPIMVVHRKMRAFQVGQSIKVLATDPLACEDFKSFCRSMGHEFVGSAEQGGVFHISIQKLR